MAKDKKRSSEILEKNETIFYYEAIGIILLTFSIAILGKLGKVGKFLMVICKCGFGDWYWFFVLFILFLGFYNLFLHKKFNFKSNFFIGFIFIFLSILILSHFPLHKYSLEKEESYLNSLWAIFAKYLNTGIETYLGGGLLGAGFFYLVYFFLGKYGVILFSLLIFMLGFSLLINKPIIDIVKFIINNLKNIGKFSSNFKDFFKYELGNNQKKIIKNQKDIFSRNISIPIKLFSKEKNDVSFSLQKDISEKNKETILLILSSLDVNYQFLDMSISYKFTTYKIKIYSHFEIDKFVKKLNELIKEDYFFGKKNSILIIQINNIHFKNLSTRELLEKQEELTNNYIIPIGIKDNGEILQIDMNKNATFLLIGSLNSGIKKFLRGLILIFFTKNYLSCYEVLIFDKFNDFNEMKEIFKINDNNLISFLDTIIEKINLRLDKMKKYDIFSFSEFNKKIEKGIINENLLRKNIIIINHVNLQKNEKEKYYEKLMYINQTASKAGLIVIAIARNKSLVDSNSLSIFDKKILFKTNKNEFDYQLLADDNSSFLLGGGDALLKENKEFLRFQTVQSSFEEFNNVIEYIKK